MGGVTVGSSYAHAVTRRVQIRNVSAARVLAVTRWVVYGLSMSGHEEAETTKENDQAHACARHVHVVLVGTNQTYPHIVLVTRVSQRPLRGPSCKAQVLSSERPRASLKFLMPEVLNAHPGLYPHSLS